jgi:hypothetical protein
MGLLDCLLPKAESASLCRAAVKEVWRQRRHLEDDLVEAARRRITDIENRKQMSIGAVVDGRISKEIFDDQMLKLGTELENANNLETRGLIQEAELDGLIDFTERLLQSASLVWFRASATNQRNIQQALFPAGLDVSEEGFRTPSTVSVLIGLDGSAETKAGLASPICIEPRPRTVGARRRLRPRKPEVW